jgi:hypothetical protein
VDPHVVTRQPNRELRERLIHDLEHHRGKRVSAERRSTLQKLVKHHAQRPDVAAVIDVARRAHLLGRHVRWSAHHGLGRGKLAVHRRKLRDSEVEDLEQQRSIGTSRDEEVGRLDVAMHDAERVRLGQGLACLQHQIDDPADGQLRPRELERSVPSRYSSTM